MRGRREVKGKCALVNLGRFINTITKQSDPTRPPEETRNVKCHVSDTQLHHADGRGQSTVGNSNPATTGSKDTTGETETAQL